MTKIFNLRVILSREIGRKSLLEFEGLTFFMSTNKSLIIVYIINWLVTCRNSSLYSSFNCLFTCQLQKTQNHVALNENKVKHGVHSFLIFSKLCSFLCLQGNRWSTRLGGRKRREGELILKKFENAGTRTSEVQNDSVICESLGRFTFHLFSIQHP